MNLSVSEVSQLLGISKDALRYYDRVGLVSPNRGENKYRHYTETDILDLQYIEVMKYVGFPLKDIKQILSNMHDCVGSDLENTQELVSCQMKRVKQFIQVYTEILKLLTSAEDLLKKKESPVHSDQIQQLVQRVFEDLKETKK